MSKRTGFGEEQQPYEDTVGEPASVGHTRLKLDSAGRVVIPAEMRTAMGAVPGEPLTAEVVDGELRVQSRTALFKRIRAQAERSRAEYPGSAVDELIADRRDEARLEDEKHERLEREAIEAERRRTERR